MLYRTMILRKKIIELVDTRCSILRLKCSKFDFGWGSAPDPAGELTAFPRPLSWIQRGLLLMEGRRKGRGGRERNGTPKSWFTHPMSEIPKNTLIIPKKFV